MDARASGSLWDLTLKPRCWHHNPEQKLRTDTCGGPMFPMLGGLKHELLRPFDEFALELEQLLGIAF